MWWLEFTFVVVFAMGWWPCCCSTPATSCCNVGTSVSGYQVAISGMANNNCTNCSNWNATYTFNSIVHCTNVIEVQPCWDCENQDVSNRPYWDGAVCSYPENGQVSLNIEMPPGVTTYGRLQVYLLIYNGSSYETQTHFFKTSISTAPFNGNLWDCDGFSSYDIPWNLDGNSACDGSGASCALTSL